MNPVINRSPSLNLIVVEDHDVMRAELVAFLQRPEWAVRGAEDGLALNELLREQAADIVVIDLNLPGEDGLSICARLRTALPEVGIVMLTARILPKDKTAGYRSGADVYLTKPANVGELEAAITNLARRLRPRLEMAWHLNLSQMLLSVGSHTIALTRLELELLYVLSLAPQRQMDTEALLHQLQRIHPSPIDRGHLAVLISRLRTKLHQTWPEAPSHDFIKAVRGQGYQLTETLVLLT